MRKEDIRINTRKKEEKGKFIDKQMDNKQIYKQSDKETPLRRSKRIEKKHKDENMKRKKEGKA